MGSHDYENQGGVRGASVRSVLDLGLSTANSQSYLCSPNGKVLEPGTRPMANCLIVRCETWEKITIRGTISGDSAVV